MNDDDMTPDIVNMNGLWDIVFISKWCSLSVEKGNLKCSAEQLEGAIREAMEFKGYHPDTPHLPYYEFNKVVDIPLYHLGLTGIQIRKLYVQPDTTVIL